MDIFQFVTCRTSPIQTCLMWSVCYSDLIWFMYIDLFCIYVLNELRSTWTLFSLAYSSIGCAMLFGSFALAYGAMKASSDLHMNLVLNCLRSPMSFFDTTPVGRLVNRFSRDMDTIDYQIPDKFQWSLKCINEVLGTIFIICYGTPFFLIPLLPLLIFYYLVQVFLCSRVSANICGISVTQTLQFHKCKGK